MNPKQVSLSSTGSSSASLIETTTVSSHAASPTPSFKAVIAALAEASPVTSSSNTSHYLRRSSMKPHKAHKRASGAPHICNTQEGVRPSRHSYPAQALPVSHHHVLLPVRSYISPAVPEALTRLQLRERPLPLQAVPRSAPERAQTLRLHDGVPSCRRWPAWPPSARQLSAAERVPCPTMHTSRHQLQRPFVPTNRQHHTSQMAYSVPTS